MLTGRRRKGMSYFGRCILCDRIIALLHLRTYLRVPRLAFAHSDSEGSAESPSIPVVHLSLLPAHKDWLNF